MNIVGGGVIKMVEKFENLLVKGNIEFQWKIKQDLEQIELTKKKIPKYPILILTCMDPRIDVHRIFQLKPSDVLILRNAGNIFTEDVLRSILISVHQYNIKLLVILGHLDCGMTKLPLNELKSKLTKPALAKILRNGTNIPIELQKYFKAFIDEIKNIKVQMEKVSKAPEIPSGLKVTGMLYDVNSGWIFEYEKFSKYTFVENFIKHYKQLIEAKKYDFIDYIESIEGDIVGKEQYQSQKNTKSQNIILGEKQITPDLNLKKSEIITISNNLVEEQNSLKNFDELVESVQKQIDSIPKIQVPKIIIPKVKVHIPKIYKVRNKE